MCTVDVFEEEFQGDWKLSGMLVQDLLDSVAVSLVHAYCYVCLQEVS